MSSPASSASPRRLATLVVAASLLVGGIAWLVTGLLPTKYTAEQVVGVVVNNQPADATLSATRRWAAVGDSESFRTQVAGASGKDITELASLAVTPAPEAPVMIVTTEAETAAEARDMLTAATSTLVKQAQVTDPAFPLVALTEASATKAEPVAPALVAGGAAAFTLAAGAALAREASRAKGSRARRNP